MLLAWLLVLRCKATYWSACASNDQRAEALLADGTIRLLSCQWLRAQPEQAVQPGVPLPEEAFLSPEEASELFLGRSRRVALLSYVRSEEGHANVCGKVQAFLRAATMSTMRRYERMLDDLVWYGSLHTSMLARMARRNRR